MDYMRSVTLSFAAPETIPRKGLTDSFVCSVAFSSVRLLCDFATARQASSNYQLKVCSNCTSHVLVIKL